VSKPPDFRVNGNTPYLTLLAPWYRLLLEFTDHGCEKPFMALMEGQNGENSCDELLMSGSGLARSIEGSHQQREITRRGPGGAGFFVDIPDAANIQPVHAAGIELMREVSLDSFPRWLCNRLPRSPRMRRRLAYTASFSAGLPFQLRSPRSGSAM